MDDIYSFCLYSATASYGLPPKFIHRSELPTQGFSSLYSITEWDAASIHEEGTASSFKGVVFTDTLWVDIDSYEAAGTVERRLREMGYEHIAYDSGGKGAHFAVKLNTHPSHLLPAKCKAWVKAHFPEADTSIYTHLHPFRIGGSIHERTGRRKEVVYKHEGKVLVFPKDILKEVPNVNLNYPTDFSNDSTRSIFRLGRVMSNTKPFSNGERHAALVRLAYALRDDYGASKELAAWWLAETNKLFQEPKTEEEVASALRSIYA